MEEYGVTIAVKEMLHLADHIIPDEHQHWVSPTFICEVTEGTPEIQEPEKCTDMGWFSLEEAHKLPLSIVTKQDIEILLERAQNADT
jgi:ADP-ribose pyrophosphatase YjhB (NUDIX family)